MLSKLNSRSDIKTIVIYALSMAGLIFILKLVEYNYFIKDLKLEFYVGIVAVLFSAIGVWAGTRLISKKVVIKQEIIQVAQKEVSAEAIKESGLTQRELEVLQLMANGLSNQEIGDKLFVSLSTVKTHSTNIFMKLNVKRRTQAIQKAKETGIL